MWRHAVFAWSLDDDLLYLLLCRKNSWPVSDTQRCTGSWTGWRAELSGRFRVWRSTWGWPWLLCRRDKNWGTAWTTEKLLLVLMLWYVGIRDAIIQAKKFEETLFFFFFPSQVFYYFSSFCIWLSSVAVVTGSEIFVQNAYCCVKVLMIWLSINLPMRSQ